MESPTLPMRPRLVADDEDSQIGSLRDIDREEGQAQIELDSLPKYLRSLFEDISVSSNVGNENGEVKSVSGQTILPIIPLPQIPFLRTQGEQYFHLLLLRHYITESLIEVGTCPELILDRARTHEALGYPELAVGDGVVALELFEVLLGEGDSELVPVDRNGAVLNSEGSERDDEEEEAAEDEDDDEEDDDEDDCEETKNDSNELVNEQESTEAMTRITTHDTTNDAGPVKKKREALLLKYQCLLVLYRCAVELEISTQAELWWKMAVLTCEIVVWHRLDAPQIISRVEKDVENVWSLHVSENQSEYRNHTTKSMKSKAMAMLGSSQRLIYPWNTHEPDRMAANSLEEINARLKQVAPDLEVRKSVLPALKIAVPDDKVMPSDQITMNGSGTTPARIEELEWSQLGLYATKDLLPSSVILTERSVLTGIRPHGEALCDACATDMEDVPVSSRLNCPGCDIPFCSQECYTSAMTRYHYPNNDDEETEEGYPPASTPFCSGPSAGTIAEIHSLGRAESSTLPEWDLYFLLLARTLQMAETQDIHPLDLFEVRYLWGDFQSIPKPTDPNFLLLGLLGQQVPKTLPYTLHHHVELPLQWFETLMLSRGDCTPYSKKWLERYDWWILQTLFAKFRGVADAKQSTWTGKAESAAVHPLWCLANHSCDPTVTWKSGGVRNLTVVDVRVWNEYGDEKDRDGNDGKEGEREWDGIKNGDQIWNHYTDVQHVDYKERRARLREVLGGECLCRRCVYQESQAVKKENLTQEM